MILKPSRPRIEGGSGGLIIEIIYNPVVIMARVPLRLTGTQTLETCCARGPDRY